MAKYLQITESSGKIRLIPIGEGLYVERTSSTAMRIYSNSMGSLHHYALVTVGASNLMVTAIQEALQIAAETGWTSSVRPVVLPAGETVTSITVSVF